MKRVFKITLLVRDLRAGGVLSLVSPLARQFLAQGHEVVIYNLGRSDEIAQGYLDGITIVSGERGDGGGYRYPLHLALLRVIQRPDSLLSGG